MARTIFTILALISLFFSSSHGSPISIDSTCITPTFTTDDHKLIGYVQATATPGMVNIFPLQKFSDHHMIGGNAYHPSVVNRATVEWGCQYSCGSNCFAFFVYFDSDTTAGKVPHYECRVYAAPFAQSDLNSSPKKEWTKGQAFNKQCYGNAMKFKRVVAADLELGTAGTKDAAAPITPAGPYPTIVSTKTGPPTKTVTVTIKQKSLGTPLKAATAVPTYIAWAETWAKTVSASAEPLPPSDMPSTMRTTPPSSCSRSAWVTDGATVTGFIAAPAPTISSASYDIDPTFSTSHLISQLYLNDKALGAAVSKCAKACNAHPQCVAFIVTEGRYPTSLLTQSMEYVLKQAYHVLWAQVTDVRAVTKPDGSVSWTCDLYKHALGAAQMVVAPQNERAIAAFNDMCPEIAA